MVGVEQCVFECIFVYVVCGFDEDLLYLWLCGCGQWFVGFGVYCYFVLVGGFYVFFVQVVFKLQCCGVVVGWIEKYYVCGKVFVQCDVGFFGQCVQLGLWLMQQYVIVVIVDVVGIDVVVM